MKWVGCRELCSAADGDHAPVGLVVVTEVVLFGLTGYDAEDELGKLFVGAACAYDGA